MDNANLILGDSLFAFGLILAVITGGIKEYTIILLPLLTVAFATCVVRHINHYNDTGRFY